MQNTAAAAQQAETANQTAENTTSATSEQMPTPQTANPDGNIPIPQASPITQTAATPETEVVATAEEKPKRTSLFSFGRKKQNDSVLSENNVATAPTDVTSQNPTTQNASDDAISKQAAPEQAAKTKLVDSTNAENSSTQNSLPNGTIQTPPERDLQSQQKGSLARLFGGTSPKPETKTQPEEKVAMAPVAPKKDPREYSDSLPGVRPNGGIVIKHRSSMYDDTDIDANESDDIPSFSLASAGSLGRSLPNGLRIARPDVQVSCMKPQLVSMLKTIERRFGQPVIITSGYRSPVYNRKVNGAKRSMHMSCAAADIIVVGVNKWDVAKFARGLPGRGGVGTYCHQAIHVDVGPKRDWNWSCSGKK